MRTGFTLKTLAVALAWLCAATGSGALTLGRAQGPALVGQALDLRIQVQFDSSEDAQSACLNAEVFYGDSQVDPSRVRVAVDAGADTARPATVRVSTTTPVNEPVVTVNLRSGCQMRSSKRYTLLADLPTQVVEQQPARAPSRVAAPRVELPVVAAAVPALPAAAAMAQEPAADPAPRTTRPRTPKTAPAAAPDADPAAAPVRKPAISPTVPSRVTPPVRAAAAPAARLPQPSRPANRARLKLDPLDLLIEKDPVLRATDELLSQPQEGGPQRAEAAALWRALNATPEQILREEVQAQRAAADLKALYTVTNQNQKGLIELAAKLERTESERYANGLVYTLAALCLLALGALVWIWQRIRAPQVVPDWRKGQDADDSLLAELLEAKKSPGRGAPAAQPPLAEPLGVAPTAPAAPVTPPPPATATVATRVAAPPPAALTEVDFDLDLIGTPDDAPLRNQLQSEDPWAQPAAEVPSSWRRLEVPQLPTAAPHEAPHGGIDFSVSMSPALRAIGTEELEDIRHQAEFFVSLGQHDKAIDILTTRIAQCGESSPLVCLDLLNIYHALGRESEYEFMRSEFQHWFAARVPAFGEFGDEGRALDRYPEVMARINRLWPGPPVLEFIEECLYHHSGALGGQVFDLQAYRDLLLLHTVAKRIIRMADDNGHADSHIPEVVRIPARAQSSMILDTPDSRRTPTHRAGGYLRGVPSTRGALDEPDPQADVETRGAPLGPMRLPPAPPQEERPAPANDPVDPNLTDFNFLNLR